jgi:transposase-like protein
VIWFIVAAPNDKEAPMMNSDARTFRQAAAQHLGNRTGTAIRYSPALRGQAVAFAQRRGRSGIPVAAMARELGLRPRVLRLWLQEPRTKPRLRRVALEAAPAASAPSPGPPVLVTPHGFRVEGLDVTSLVTLLRGLV